MSMVLVTWDLVLFEGMSVKFKGKIVTVLQESEMTAGFHCRHWILCI